MEISPERSAMMQRLCKHLSVHGGAALIGDYGHWGEKEDTFRVVFLLFYHNIFFLIN